MTFLSASATCTTDRLTIRGEIHNRSNRRLYVQDRPAFAHPCDVSPVHDGAGANGSWLLSSGELLVVVGSTSFVSPPEGGPRYPTPYAWPQPNFTRVEPGARHPLTIDFKLPVLSHMGGGTRSEYRKPDEVRLTSRVWLLVRYEWPLDESVQEQPNDGSTSVWLREPTRDAAEQLQFELAQPIAAEDPGLLSFWGDSHAEVARTAPSPDHVVRQLGISVRE